MKKTPLITIIGVPNTGKSTFFNRIIGARKALVHADPGMTRDIFKKAFDLSGKKFYIQDSGGFFQDKDIISEEINKRIFREARRSDLIIFLFDGKRELLGYEKDLYLEVTRINPDIIPVINKVDNPNKFILPPSYYSLKRDLIYVSAEHDIGIDEVFEQIEKKFEQYAGREEEEVQPPARISIVGKPNVGKSSIINSILKDDFVIVSPIPGTTRDSVDLEIKWQKKTVVLVDNAGIRKLQKVKEGTEGAAVLRAEKDVKFADIIILVLDLSKKIDQNDLFIAHQVFKAAKPVIIAGNKWDLLTGEIDSPALMEKINRKFNFLHFAPILFVSAKTGKNIFRIIDLAIDIQEKLTIKVRTPALNQLIRQILQEKVLHTQDERIFNPKYIVIESYKPFFINFFTHSGNKLKSAHEKYLKKRIGEELKLQGIPVFFKISSSTKHKTQ